MPTQPFNVIQDVMTAAELSEELAKLQKLVRYIINGQLDFENIRAKGIKTDNLDAGAVTADKIDVNELSAISADLGTITAGLLTAVTIIGSLIQTSASSYPRVEIDPATTLFKAEQSATSRVEMAASYSGSSPALLIYQGVGLKLQIQEIDGTDVLIATLNGDRLQLSPSSHLFLNPNGDVRLNPTGDVRINGSTGWTGTYNDGTNTITVVKGIITNVV